MTDLAVKSSIRIKKDVVGFVTRHLPYAQGKILVQVGEELSPETIIAEAGSSPGFRTIHLSSELGISPRDASKCLKRSLNQTIFQGELLASSNNLWGLKKKVLLSPVDGILDKLDEDSGKLRLKLLPKRIKLVSGMYGIVEDINRSTLTVTIKTLTTHIYGIMGTGKERGGILKIVCPPSDLISSKQIDLADEGKILVGGSMIFNDALTKAVNYKVAGIISGGISAGEFKTMTKKDPTSSLGGWSDVGFSLMVTEGYGVVSLGEDIYKELKRFNGRFVLLDGNTSRLTLPSFDQHCMMYIRNTVLPPGFKVEGKPASGHIKLEKGIKVKVISLPFLGSQGIVESIDQTPTLLPSGIKTHLVNLALSKGRCRVPYQNLEAII